MPTDDEIERVAWAIGKAMPPSVRDAIGVRHLFAAAAAAIEAFPPIVMSRKQQATEVVPIDWHKEVGHRFNFIHKEVGSADIDEVAKFGERRLLCAPNVSKVTVDRLEKVLAHYGRTLRP